MATNDKSDIRTEEFRALFKSLMDAYQPALDQIQLPTATPDELLKQAQLAPSCDEEAALAARIFERRRPPMGSLRCWTCAAWMPSATPSSLS